MGNKVAIYTRVSTTDQTVENQQIALREYAEKRGWNIYREYSDVASGAKEDRKELKELMSEAKKRKFDVVLVWKFDRFARSLIHLLTALKTFEEIGVDFMSLQDSIDTTTSSGRLMFSVIGAFAQFERDIIRERTILGLNRAKSKGIKLGRRKLDYNIQQQIGELKSKGLSLQKIADKLGIAKGSVFNYLKEN
jgi:DNA invertase Pin-like site-specific DNA recombinase